MPIGPKRIYGRGHLHFLAFGWRVADRFVPRILTLNLDEWNVDGIPKLIQKLDLHALEPAGRKVVQHPMQLRVCKRKPRKEDSPWSSWSFKEKR